MNFHNFSGIPNWDWPHRALTSHLLRGTSATGQRKTDMDLHRKRLELAHSELSIGSSPRVFRKRITR